MSENDSIKNKARKRAEDKAGFFVHLAVYLGVNLLLAVINFATMDEADNVDIWFIWPLFGWGIGLAFHFFGVFFGDSIVESYIDKQARVEEKKLKEKGSKKL